jgi:hypothetical protein
MAQVTLGCRVAVSSSVELDTTQMTLTRLLEEALRRYRSHYSSVHTYMSSLESMTSKLQSEKRALQVSSEWELKYEALLRQFDTVR